ncbi:hypothetical protein [Nostoc sp. CALU 1950]|uniref:hypothetical protein n=1 Tax=Nostoc sp. CALU 1950 TaxID=3104321 RepID=UPI003EBD58E2
MYDDSAQGESDDDKKPKSLLDMKCDKLGRHTPGFLTTPLKACAGEQGSRGAGESSNTKFFPLCPSAPLPLCPSAPSNA